MDTKKISGRKAPLRLRLEDYEVLKTLGAGTLCFLWLGSYGRVKLAKNKSTGEYVAIKIMCKSEIIKQQQVEHVIGEYGILGFITHPFIVLRSNEDIG